MKLLPYEPRYINEVVNLWNRTLDTDPITEQRFLNIVVLDENFDPEFCLIAVDEGKVVGFIWSIIRKIPYGDRGLESDRGWIAAIFVDANHQNQGIGTLLINTVETKMVEKGIKNITLGAYSPNYLFPGVEKNRYPNARSFFEKNGYEKNGNAVSMERSLFDFTKTEKYLKLYEKVMKNGYKLSGFNLSDTGELLEFLHSNFGGGWSRNVQNAILEDRAYETILVLRNKDNKIVGFAQRAIDKNPDRFGPFGVEENLRGEGLGAILFNEMLFDMLSRGITHAYFLWTSGKAQRFYEKNGMKIYRDFDLMKKYLS